MNKQQLELKGNVHIIQMISMRDKKTGKYLPLMDGNLNSMLHRIWTFRNQLKNVYITLPNVRSIDHEQLNRLDTMIEKLFNQDPSTELRVWANFNSAIYRKDVGKTRMNLLSRDYPLEFDGDRLDMIVSEFPVDIEVDGDTQVVYNYNWSAVDKANDILNISHKREIELAKKYPTYLFSDIQYDYWKEQGVDLSNTYRSTNIYSKEFFKLVAEYFAPEPTLHDWYETAKMNGHDLVFFPQRIDDPRYDFERVCSDIEFAARTGNNFKLVVTNPTNVPVPKKDYIINMSDHPDKRTLYFTMLLELEEDDMIVHKEDDMHVSLLEQIAITKATVHHHIPDVEEYFTKG